MQCLRVKDNSRNINSGYILVMVSIFLIGFILITSAPSIPMTNGQEEEQQQQSTTISNSSSSSPLSQIIIIIIIKSFNKGQLHLFQILGLDMKDIRLQQFFLQKAIVIMIQVW
jgi:hypothetical protein